MSHEREIFVMFFTSQCEIIFFFTRNRQYIEMLQCICDSFLSFKTNFEFHNDGDTVGSHH